MSDKIDRKYLAILFFNKDYKRQPVLSGVGTDESELNVLLEQYDIQTVNNSGDILEDLQIIVQERNEAEEEFERVHFHFSGHGKDNRTVEIEGKEAVDPDGECVLGTGLASKLCRVHDLKTELLRLNTKKITMTLDCCRDASRGPVISLQEKKVIELPEQEKMFIFHGTRQTLTASDGLSFTQALAAVCRENGGALPILDIEKKVNARMNNQKCEVERVLDGDNWENYMWPNDVDCSSRVNIKDPNKSPNITVVNTVKGSNNKCYGGNIVMGNHTVNYM